MGDEDELGSLFANPIILLPEAENVKLVIDARYLNSITNITNCSWPPEPVQMNLIRINGNYFKTSDFSCAYHQVPLSPEKQKLTSFVIGGKQYTYRVGVYGLCGLPQLFSRMMAITLEPLIKKKAISYLDDSLLQSVTKAEMFTIIHENHQLFRKRGLKTAPDNTHFFPEKSNIPWPCYLRTRDSTSCKKSKRHAESEISREQKRCNENPRMPWLLELLHQ